MNYILSCCSTADLAREHFERRNIPFVNFHFIMDGTQYDDDLGKSMPFEEFYGKVANGAAVTTAQVNVGEYTAFFTPFLEKGMDVLHISLSSGISGSYGAACIARDDLRKRYPDRKIEVIDSLGASSGYGLFMDMLADRRDAGMGYEELMRWAEANRLKIHHWFFSTDLTAYIKGGRISKAAGIFGTILEICPLLNMDAAGHLTPRAKIRTKRKVMNEIVERMKEHADGGKDYSGKCYISNSGCIDDAREVAKLVKRTFPKIDGEVEINSVGTVIGAHTGIGTVALFFVGDTRADK